MTYHVIDPYDIEQTPGRPSETHYVSEAIGMNNMGLRFYDVNPGEDIPNTQGLHYHDEQEEVFFVVSGELTVETPEETYIVPQGSFFIAEPKNAHYAYNHPDATENVTVVAIGAPSVQDGHAYDSDET